MKKKTKKIIIFSILFLIIALFSTLLMPFTRKDNSELKSYEYVLRDSIKNDNLKVVDIAMLGAHDAFSNEIKYSSASNVNEDGIFNNKIVNTLGKGLCIRLSKAQIADAKTMLYAGVRYFDVRISKLDGIYYTVHGYVSDKLEVYLQDIVDFLGSHNGEFIIFDIQHFFTENGTNYELDKKEYQDLVEYMMTIKNSKGYSIIDYTNYDSISSIENLRYYNITDNRTTAGCVILADVTDISCIYNRGQSIRSNWHQENSTSAMLDGINEEYEILENYDRDFLVVNQAQKTGFITSAKLVRSLFKWSLINLADDFNKVLVSDEVRFKKWLSRMPIFMVDYTTSTKGNFNNLANEYIMEYNSTL